MVSKLLRTMSADIDSSVKLTPSNENLKKWTAGSLYAYINNVYYKHGVKSSLQN